MSALSLILGNRKSSTIVGLLRLDAAISISHSATATPTSNPIEARSGDPTDDFTDNIRLQPRQLNITGFISEAPLNLFASLLNLGTGVLATRFSSSLNKRLGGFATTALAAGIGSLVGLIANRNEDDIQYPQKSFDYLIELRDKKVPFTVVTRLKKYENMVITSLNVPQDKQDGNSLRFTATFQQVNIVNTQIVEIPETTVSNQSAASKQNLGKQAPKETSTSSSEIATQRSEQLEFRRARFG